MLLPFGTEPRPLPLLSLGGGVAAASSLGDRAAAAAASLGVGAAAAVATLGDGAVTAVAFSGAELHGHRLQTASVVSTSSPVQFEYFVANCFASPREADYCPVYSGIGAVARSWVR